METLALMHQHQQPSRGQSYWIKAQGSAANRYRIEFAGNLPLGWAGALALGLTKHSISIQSGYAKRHSLSGWKGTMNVLPMAAGVKVQGLDFVAMLESREHMEQTRVTPRLKGYDVRECSKGNGSVYVKVDGEDTLGFLAAMFRCFSFHMLYPWEMQVHTDNRGVIRDEFHLMGAAGLVPSRRVIDSLHSELSQMMVK